MVEINSMPARRFAQQARLRLATGTMVIDRVRTHEDVVQPQTANEHRMHHIEFTTWRRPGCHTGLIGRGE
jgi:hypothetical protein